MANNLSSEGYLGAQPVHWRIIFSIVALIIISSALPLCKADVTLSESIRLAQCRASCLEHMSRHSARHTREKPCQSNCEMCWNTCRLLQGDSPAGASLCADHSACFPGCQTACQYYRTASSSLNLNHSPRFNADSFRELPAQMKVAHIRDDMIEWNVPKWHEPSSSRPVVYVLMKKVGHSWKEIIQTIHQSTTLVPSIQDGDKLSLFVVTSLGIASFANVSRNAPPPSTLPSSTLIDSKIYEENSPSNFGTNTYIANESQLLTKEHKYLDKDFDYSDYGNFGDMEPPLVSVDHSWKVDLIPLSVELLARVKVSWDVRGSGHDDYLISWMEKFGVVSGHLVARETEVEISLWAGQQYVIKVELLDKHGNAVLRSGSLPIRFNSSIDSSNNPRSVHPVKMNTPASPRAPATTSPPAKPSPPRGFSVSRRVKEHFGIREEHVYFPRDESVHQVHGTPKVSQSYTDDADSRGVMTPRFRYVSNSNINSTRRLSGIEEPSTDSQKIKSETEPEPESDSLLIWAVCLGVGAVIILILIALAVRTLKQSLTKGRQERRSEDFLSETTASSINSASTSNNVPSIREEFPYESFYNASDQQIRTFLPLRHNVHHHPPIPYPPPAPPIPIMNPPHPHAHALHHNCTQQQSALAQAQAQAAQQSPSSPNPNQDSNNDALRIGREFLIENYILSLDPAPTFKYVLNNS